MNGCFWHRCPKCNLPLPSTHTEYWSRKFSRNVERDRVKAERLTAMGWRVITLWECDIRRSPQDAAVAVKCVLAESTKGC